MQVSLPPPGNLTLLINALRGVFSSVVSQDQACNRIILASPNGTTYAITVDNAGTVTSTAITGKTREI